MQSQDDQKNHATYHIFILENTHTSISFAKSHKKKSEVSGASTADVEMWTLLLTYNNRIVVVEYSAAAADSNSRPQT